MPDFMMGVMPGIDWLSHRLMGTARSLTPEMAATLKGRSWNITNARAKKDLGWAPTISLEQSLKETIATLEANKRSA